MDSNALEATIGGRAPRRSPMQVLMDIEGPGSTFEQDVSDYFSYAQLLQQVLRSFVRSFVRSFIHSFIHPFQSRWANHDHLTILVTPLPLQSTHAGLQNGDLHFCCAMSI